MADQSLDQVRIIVEGQIDFEGQKTAEYLATGLLAILGGLAFIVGYILQDIKLALQLGLGGAVVTAFAVVPPWPFFNKNPVRWLPVAGSELRSQGVLVDGKVVE